MRVSTLVTVILGVLSVAGLVLSHLALNDIAKAVEPDLSMEWNMVRIGFFIMVLFIGSVFVNLFFQRRAFRSWGCRP